MSAADPNDILKNMKVGHEAVITQDKVLLCGSCGPILCPLSVSAQDMDDMDADLFGSKKKPSAQTKPLGNEGSKKGSPTVKSEVKPEGAGNLAGNWVCFYAPDLFPRHSHHISTSF